MSRGVLVEILKILTIMLGTSDPKLVEDKTKATSTKELKLTAKWMRNQVMEKYNIAGYDISWRMLTKWKEKDANNFVAKYDSERKPAEQATESDAAYLKQTTDIVEELTS